MADLERDPRLTIRKKGKCGTYTLCDEVGNPFPQIIGCKIEEVINGLPTITVKMFIDGEQVRLVDDAHR